MGQKRFKQLAAIFEHARELEPDARRVYVDQACGDEPELRDQVIALLDRHDGGGLLDAPIRASDAPQEPIPKRIGRFRIIERLGRGGMGVVYRAEQDQPRRHVALKMMHAGLVTEELQRRFEFETSVLARLQHPGIAQIYEAGTCDAGSGPRPFFAMELVDGASLDRFIAEQKPTTEGKLRLFVAICEAVQHAHQNGIIHRDLKPANILVTAENAPKILDFGVARATDSDVQATLYTTPGQLVGTLAYMSPEQVSMATDKLDTRSDVYALGVILYELLTGQLPYEVADGSIASAIRVIEESEPKSLTSASRALRGDLDTIVLRSLRKRPEDRYQSASDLAADIRRFLEHQPIFARPATAFYHLSRFARRNRALVGGVAVAFVALVVGLLLSIYALQVASHERNENDAVTNFLSEMLASADPGRQGRDARVIDLLEAASQRVGQEFVDQPLVSAKLHHVIGTTYQALGIYDRAESHLQIAFDARMELLKEKALPTIDSMLELGVVYIHWGKYDLSQPLLERSLELYVDRVGEEHDSTLAAMGELGLLYARQGRRDLAAPLYHRCLDLRRQLFGNEHPDTLTAMNNLGVMYKKMGQYVHAEALYDETLSIRRRVLGEEHYDTLTSRNNLAHLYRALGRLTDSADLHAKTLEVRRRVLGNEHPHTQMSMDNLAMLLDDLNRFDEAEPLYDEALGLKRRVLGEEHPETLVSMDNLGRLYSKLNRTEEAAALQGQALDARRRILGTRHENTAISMIGLAVTYTSMERFDEAERLLIEALEILRDLLGNNHIEVARCLQKFATMRLEQTRFVAAEELYREALVIHQASPRPNVSRIALAQTNLAQALQGMQRWEEAERMLLAANELVAELPRAIARSQIAKKLIRLYEAWHVAVPDRGYDVEAKRWRDRQAKRGAAAANP